MLVVGAGVVFFHLGRSLWRSAQALLGEIRTASDRLWVVTAELRARAGTDTTSPGTPEEPAVFSDPTELRQQRHLAARRAPRKGPRHPGDRAGRTSPSLGSARRGHTP